MVLLIPIAAESVEVAVLIGPIRVTRFEALPPRNSYPPIE